MPGTRSEKKSESNPAVTGVAAEVAAAAMAEDKEEEKAEEEAPPNDSEEKKADAAEETSTKEAESKEGEEVKEGEAKEGEETKDGDESKVAAEAAEAAAAKIDSLATEATTTDEKKEEAPAEAPLTEEEAANAIWEPAPPDVLSGRGASVNAHQGNKKFRALCFARKPEFEAGNHAAKRRIATEITTATFADGARFLKKKKGDKGPWFAMTKQQAILKACQVMRDYKRPDRMAMREMMQQNGSARKRSRSQEPSTPLLDTPVPTGPLEPIIENPFGVHDHDVLSGRGAYVNGHVGNQRLRTLALERKTQFDNGNYTEKRALATEIVQIIRALKPPGRFLKKVTKAPPTEEEKAKEDTKEEPETTEADAAQKEFDLNWEELPDEKAIHKACQVMRDIDRPDRKDRELRRAEKKQKTDGTADGTAGGETPAKSEEAKEEGEKKEGEDKTKATAMEVLADTTAEKAAVDEAVAATEEALDKALDAASDPNKEKVAEAEAVEV